MTTKNPFTPEEIAGLQQQRQELLDLMRSRDATIPTIASCLHMLKRLDAALEPATLSQETAEQPAQKPEPLSGLVARWLTRKAS